MKVEKNSNGEWAYNTGKNLMTASCHHFAHLPGFSACGGCYARAVAVLEALAGQHVPEAQAFLVALTEEGQQHG